MVRYNYNTQLNPPAPFVHLTLHHPFRDVAIPDLAAQLDTAADISVIPGEIIDRLNLVPIEEILVAGFGGRVEHYPAYLVEVTIRGLTIVSVKVLCSQGEPYVLLGRDVLNQFRLVLDGPAGLLEID